MTTYNSLIVRSEVPMAEDRINEIFKSVGDTSVVMALGRKLRNMTSGELTLKVMSELPTVYFVDEPGVSSTYPNSDLKQTTSAAWQDVTLTARELAVIIPVSQNVINDSNFDIFAEAKEALVTAIAAKIDSAVLFGTQSSDSPDAWPTGIFTGMPAGNKFAYNAGSGDIYTNLLGDLKAFAQVELDGYDVNGIVGALRLKGLLRAPRTDSGSGIPLLTPVIQDPNNYSVAGVPVRFPVHGGFDASKALALVGDWSQLVWSIAQDVRFDVFDTGVIMDGNKAIIHNLMQEDKVALRVTFRFGWQLPTPATHITVSGVQYPFSAITPA
jgi:HK97 family phage major capsid protein